MDMEALTFIFIAICVVILAAFLFGGWVIVLFFRGIINLGKSLSGPPRQPALATKALDHARCPRSLCHAENPTHARHCRRCGASMAAERVEVRRVA
jgi:ribosomal protein L40E